jgi:hypothetical protein
MQAGTARSASKRKAQIVKSESFFLYLAQIIDANLKDEEGSENSGPVLQDKGTKGKGPAADKLLAFIIVVDRMRERRWREREEGQIESHSKF